MNRIRMKPIGKPIRYSQQNLQNHMIRKAERKYKDMHKSRTMDMTEGVIWKQMVLFALPLLAGNLFQQFYNTVDSIVVGNYVSADALAAVTSTGPAINILIGFFMGMSTGASVVISQMFGARHEASLRKAIHTAVTLTLLLGIAFSIIGYTATPFMLKAMKTPESVVRDATTYLHIYFAGVLGLMLYNIGSGILRAVGDSRRPLYFLIFSSLLNIVLDLLFVLVFHMGVAGVAYATILSQFISAAMIFVILFRTKEIYGLSIKEMQLDMKMVSNILNMGLPAGLQVAIVSFSNVFVQAYINAFGAASAAGWGVYGRIDGFVMLPLQSLGLAITTFVGQNAGAGKVERIKKGMRTALWLSAVITVVITVPLLIFAPAIVKLFSKEAEVIYFAALFLRLNEPFDIVACSNQIHAGALRGIGNAKVPMFIMVFSFVVFRQIYLFVVTHITGLIYPVSLCYPAGWLICSLIMLIYFRRSNWAEHIHSSQG